MTAKKVPAEVVVALTDADYRNITTWEDLDKLFSPNDVSFADKILGDGFAFIGSDKSTLVGLPLFLLEWRFVSRPDGDFVSIRAVQRMEDGTARKVVFNDGGAGVYRQLESLRSEYDIVSALMVPKGLTRSDYTYTDDKGVERPATTYYLSESA